jgi:hypothetical protein
MHAGEVLLDGCRSHDQGAWLKGDRSPPEEAFAWFISKSEVRWIKIPFGPAALSERVRALRYGLDAAVTRSQWLNPAPRAVRPLHQLAELG